MKTFSQMRRSLPALALRPRSRRIIGLTAGLLTLSVLAARSVLLPQNAILPPVGIPAPAPGAVIAQAGHPFVIFNSHHVMMANGVLHEIVWREAATGQLDFFQQVQMNPSPLPVTEVSRCNYPGAPVLNADFLRGPGIPPNLEVRTSNEIVFEFNLPPVGHPALNTAWFFVDTPALNFWPGGVTVLQTPDGSSTVVNTFAPQ